MDKSIVTYTLGKAWWLDCVTMSGRRRYPDIIKVGKYGNERIYVPERRCQQLEQVVREMYGALTFCTGGCAGGCPMLDDGCSVDSGALRSKLETLGVSLDD